MRRRTLLLGVPLVAASLALAGCTETGSQADGDGTNPIPGIDQWKKPTTEPVVFSGKTADGSTFRSTAHRGSVLVVNFWYAGCGPCQVESPSLVKVAKSFAGKDVQFVGINTSDAAATAQRFEQQYKVPWQSILDQENQGSAQLAFAGSRAPRAIPSTLVLDRKGRVTARMIGAADPSILTTLINDTLDGAAA